MQAKPESEGVEPESEGVGWIISGGRLFDFLGRLSFPVYAVPGQSLFRILVHGSGISLPVEGADPAVGFYVTYFVAARTVRAAEAKALEKVRDRWKTFYPESEGVLQLELDDVEVIPGRFRRRSRTGFVFYSSDDQPAAPVVGPH